jgi:uncharacterized membrane protein (UPF0127 family)
MRWAIFLVMSLILGILFWSWGGSDISDYARQIPYYYKKIIGQTVSVEINGTKIRAEMAKSAAQKTRGLAERNFLEADQGMLFIYDQAVIPTFWMKGMRFPLDLIWLKDNLVVEITENVPTDNGPEFKTYSPKCAVNRILEVNAGFCQAHGLKAGQEVQYSKKIK